MTFKEFFALPSTRSPLFVTAVKASLLTALCLLLGVVFDQLVTMSAVTMGVSAAAQADHHSQYHKRIQALVILIFCYAMTTYGVVWLIDKPYFFVVALGGGNLLFNDCERYWPSFR